MTESLAYARTGNKISKIWPLAFRYVYRLLAMTIFGQGEPTQVAEAELALLRALAIPRPTRLNWVQLFVQNCLEIQKSPTSKISIGGMINQLVWNHGIEIPQDCATLSTNASISYDYTTLRRVKFFYCKGNQDPYLVCLNGHLLSLPPQPDTLFDIHPILTASCSLVVWSRY